MNSRMAMALVIVTLLSSVVSRADLTTTKAGDGGFGAGAAACGSGVINLSTGCLAPPLLGGL